MRTILLALAVLLLASPALAGTRTFTASGSVALGDTLSKSEASRLCLAQAKRTALEEAGALVRSETTVANNTISSDTIDLFAEAFAKVEVLEESAGKDKVSCTVAVTVDPEEVREQTESALKNKGVMKVLRMMLDRVESNTLILNRLQKSVWGEVWEWKPFTDYAPLSD
jgi:hypothetical protein